jgi:hypothetical protein
MEKTNNFSIGDTVVKKSNQPFKNGEKTQTIVSFGVNEQDPKQRACAVFDDGSICNLKMLNRIITFDIETGGLFADFSNRGKGVSQGIPDGFLNSFTGSRKPNLMSILPMEDKTQGTHMFVLENVCALDTLKLVDIVGLMSTMNEKLNNEPPKTVKTEYEKIGGTTFPITYFENGVIIVDYPKNL